MSKACDGKAKALRLRCCDAVVLLLGVVVTLGSVFHREITFLLVGE